MATSLKKVLSGTSVRPIGSHVWFPDVDNAQVNPIYTIDDRTYLRSGHVLVDEGSAYPEAYEKFGRIEGAGQAGTIALGIPNEETQGDAVKYMRIK